MISKDYITQQKEPFFQIANELINVDSVVLDIGAGDGSFAKHCERRDFYLFDGNKTTVDTLKQSYEYVFFGKLPELPFEDSFFDIIHCSHVIEHLKPQELYASIKEMDRCLKNDGYIVISTPLLWDRFYDDLSHIKPYNYTIFEKYLTEKDVGSKTRDSISRAYSIISLTYRYREYNLTDGFFVQKNKWLLYPLFKVVNLLYKIGLRNYKKNGYTIVLKKDKTS